MSIISSLFCGSLGSYNLPGIKINFVNHGYGSDAFSNTHFRQIAGAFTSNRSFQILSLGYLHVFVHEMGHALASKILNHSGTTTIDIKTGTCSGTTSNMSPGTFASLAGPLAGVTFEIVKLVGAVALAVLLPTPIGLPLGILIGAGSIVWIFGELMYALHGQVDWAEISENGHYIASFSALIAAIILGSVAAAALIICV